MSTWKPSLRQTQANSPTKSSVKVSSGSKAGRSIFDEASVASSSSLRILRKVNSLLSTADATAVIAPTSRPGTHLDRQGQPHQGKRFNGTNAVSPANLARPVQFVSTASPKDVQRKLLVEHKKDLPFQSTSSHKEHRSQYQMQHARSHCGTRYWPAGARPEQMTRSRRRQLRTATAAVVETDAVSSARVVSRPQDLADGKSSWRNSEVSSDNIPHTKEACGRALLSAALRLHVEEELLNSLCGQAGAADANGECSFSAETMSALRQLCGVEFVQDLHQLSESRVLALTGIPEDEKARLIRLCAYLKRQLPYEDLKSAQLPVKRTFIHFKRTPTTDISAPALRDSAPGQIESSQFHTKDGSEDYLRLTLRAFSKESDVDLDTSGVPAKSDELFNTHDSFA